MTVDLASQQCWDGARAVIYTKCVLALPEDGRSSTGNYEKGLRAFVIVRVGGFRFTLHLLFAFYSSFSLRMTTFFVVRFFGTREADYAPGRMISTINTWYTYYHIIIYHIIILLSLIHI